MINTALSEHSKDEDNEPNTIIGLIEKHELSFPFTVKRVRYSSESSEDVHNAEYYGLGKEFTITDVYSDYFIEDNGNLSMDWFTNIYFDDITRMDAREFPDYTLISR